MSDPKKYAVLKVKSLKIVYVDTKDEVYNIVSDMKEEGDEFEAFKHIDYFGYCKLDKYT